MRQSAVAREAARRNVGADQIELKYVDEGMVTGLPTNNWTSAKIALRLRSELETIIYLVTAQQIGTTADCDLRTTLLLETRPLNVDRADLARRIAGPTPPDGLWRALEAIDLEFPHFTKGYERLTVALVEGDARAELYQPITLDYRFGWGGCAEECRSHRTYRVQFERRITAPRIQIVAQEGDPRL